MISYGGNEYKAIWEILVWENSWIHCLGFGKKCNRMMSCFGYVYQGFRREDRLPNKYHGKREHRSNCQYSVQRFHFDLHFSTLIVGPTLIVHVPGNLLPG